MLGPPFALVAIAGVASLRGMIRLSKNVSYYNTVAWALTLEHIDMLSYKRFGKITISYLL